MTDSDDSYQAFHLLSVPIPPLSSFSHSLYNSLLCTELEKISHTLVIRSGLYLWVGQLGDKHTTLCLEKTLNLRADTGTWIQLLWCWTYMCGADMHRAHLSLWRLISSITYLWWSHVLAHYPVFVLLFFVMDDCSCSVKWEVGSLYKEMQSCLKSRDWTQDFR